MTDSPSVSHLRKSHTDTRSVNRFSVTRPSSLSLPLAQLVCNCNAASDLDGIQSAIRTRPAAESCVYLFYWLTQWVVRNYVPVHCIPVPSKLCTQILSKQVPCTLESMHPVPLARNYVPVSSKPYISTRNLGKNRITHGWNNPAMFKN